MRIPFFHSKSDHIKFGHERRFFWNYEYSVRTSDVRTHMHVMGKSGSGKSNFLAALFLALHRAGMGATLIDPHGDLADLILAHLVAQGTFDTDEGYKRVVYLDLPAAEDQNRFLPFNVLAQNAPPDVVASNIRDSFHRA